MRRQRWVTGLLALAALTTVAAAGRAEPAEPAVRGEGRYQIVEATPDRVWRLDTRTGEISMCKLAGDRLICTHSSQAAEPPRADYETLQAQREAQEEAEAKRQLRFLDKMLEMFRELVRYALQREGEGGGQP